MEFAFVAPLLFAFVFITIDLAYFWHAAESFRTYVSEVLRATIIAVAEDGNPGKEFCSNAGKPVEVTTPLTPGLDPERVTKVEVSCTRITAAEGGSGATASRKVVARYTYTHSFMVLGALLSDWTVEERQETEF